MKRYLTTLLIALHFCAFGQNFDELMEKRQLSCSDVSYNSTKLFEEYYQNNDIDLAKKLLNYWEEKCEVSEPLLRAKILIAIHENRFFEGLLTDNGIIYILKYKDRMKIIEENQQKFYEYYQDYYDFVPVARILIRSPEKHLPSLKKTSAVRQRNISYATFMVGTTKIYSRNCKQILTKALF